MGCLLAVLALASPRLALVLVWLFTDRVAIAYDSLLVPLLGLVFLPWTALVYTVAYAPAQGVSPLGWCCVGVALLADVASYLGGARKRAETKASGYRFAPAPHSTDM